MLLYKLTAGQKQYTGVYFDYDGPGEMYSDSHKEMGTSMNSLTRRVACRVGPRVFPLAQRHPLSCINAYIHIYTHFSILFEIETLQIWIANVSVENVS